MNEIAYVITEDVRHQTLECSRGVAVTLLHHVALVRTEYGREGGLVDILGYNSDLFIGVAKIDLGSNLSSGHIGPYLVLIR